MRPGKNPLVVCWLAAVLWGCAGPAVEPTGVPSGAMPTQVTSPAAATVTTALVATATPGPATGTATPSRTPRPATVTPVNTRPPTPDARSTALVEAVMTAQPPRLLQSLTSLDGAWQAEVIVYDCVDVGGVDNNAVELVTLTRISTGEAVVAGTQLLNCGGVGAYGFEAQYWSPSGRYFYYVSGRESVPDGFCGFWVRPLYRYDTVTGEIQMLGEGPRSPDGSQIATWGFAHETQQWVLELWDLEKGLLESMPALLPDIRTGPITWAPDGEALAYLQWSVDCGPSGKTTVVRVDLPELTQTVALEQDEPGFNSLLWDAPYRLRLWDGEGGRWSYHWLERRLTRLQ